MEPHLSTLKHIEQDLYQFGSRVKDFTREVIEEARENRLAGVGLAMVVGGAATNVLATEIRHYTNSWLEPLNTITHIGEYVTAAGFAVIATYIVLKHRSLYKK